MKLRPRMIKESPDKTPLFLTFFVAAAFLFQLFYPGSSELTAAGPVKPAAPQSEKTPAPAGPVILEHLKTELKRGSTLQSLLLNAGIALNETGDIIDAVSPFLDLTRLKAGQEVEIFFEEQQVKKIVIPASIDKDIQVVRRGNGGFVAEEYLKDLFVYPTQKKLKVDSSLYGSAAAAGIPDDIIMDLIMLFSFDVDFQRDIQRGDELSAVYELIYDEQGNPLDTGHIIQAALKTKGQDLTIFRYVSGDGKADFYDENGHTIRKTLLKTPINGAYITSSFGMRVNPFSGYTTMHKGVDFGAPPGTPINASGDGRVVYAGYNEIYGNHVILRHVSHYETLYAHMTSFGRGIRREVSVDQGQIIGYVGSTGMSTGPHLHYEVRYYGRQVNPSSVKFPPGRVLEGEELRLFQNQLQSFRAAF